MTFRLDDSVFAHLTQSEVKSGVLTLLGHGTKSLPTGLKWQEVPQFYAALRSAFQVKIEYAISLERLWRAIWGDAIEAPWKGMTPDEQVQYDDTAEPNVDDCWDCQWFGRSFTVPKKPHVLMAAVSVEESGYSVGFSLFKGQGVTPLVKVLPEFIYNRDVKSLWTEPRDVPIVREPDLSRLRDLATSAFAAASEVL